MAANIDSQGPWVSFHLNGEMYAVPAQSVQTMLALPDVVHVPHMPGYIRGVINLRGKVVPVMDLRARLKMTSRLQEVQEFIEMLDAREQDHRNWLAELEASIREQREFRGQLDPHKCAFGRWYDHYKTDNFTMNQILAKFDAPHKRIHALAGEVIALGQAGDYDSAYARIENTRNTDLHEMIEVFTAFKDVIRKSANEIAIILETSRGNFGIAVDSTEMVEHFDPSNINELDSSSASSDRLVSATAHRDKEDKLIMLLQVERLMEQDLPEYFSEPAAAPEAELLAV